MATHGKILDLFDDRYMKVLDVTGEVWPFPALVPYEEYTEDVTVFEMNQPVDTFVAALQDFTDRVAQQTEQETWSWIVQWILESPPGFNIGLGLHTGSGLTPLAKKLCINSGQATPMTSTYPIFKPPMKFVERRHLPSDLLRNEDVLRILLDIVHVPSTVVPNFVEFLYRWIDYYEGDGEALQCALRGEIPSLWDFDEHPVVLPDATNATDADKAKSKRKPDLKELEKQAQESERLQYREVRYGLQLPFRDNGTLPRFINVPEDASKQVLYYASCYKSRQRAFLLLAEAGITKNQIKNYVQGQRSHPRDTSDEDEGGYLEHYERDKMFHNQWTVRRQREQVQKKWRETQMSAQLAVEAQQADRAAYELIHEAEGSNRLAIHPPLIPGTSMYSPQTPASARPYFTPPEEESEWFDESIPTMPYHLACFVTSESTRNARPVYPDGDDIHIDMGRSDDGYESTQYSYEGDDIDPLLRDGSDDENGGAATGGNGNSTAPMSNAQAARLQNEHEFRAFIAAHGLSAFNQMLSNIVAGNHAFVNVPQGGSNTQAAPVAGPSNATGIAPLHLQTASVSQVPAHHPASTVVVSHTAQIYNASNGGAPTQLHQHYQAGGGVAQSYFSYTQGAMPNGQVQNPQVPNPQVPNPQVPNPTFPNALYMPYGNGNGNGAGAGVGPAPGTVAPPGIQRVPPPPLNLVPPSPSTNLPAVAGSSQLSATPKPMPTPKPVLAHFPQIVQERQLFVDYERTDAILLGHLFQNTGEIKFSHAVFPPAQIEAALLRNLDRGWSRMETYVRASTNGNGKGKEVVDRDNCHEAAYNKLMQAHYVMVSTDDRENQLTKRWTVAPAPIFERERGAVWEGWAAGLDREIYMSARERMDAEIPGGDEPDEFEISREEEVNALMEYEEQYGGGGDEYGYRGQEDDDDLQMGG